MIQRKLTIALFVVCTVISTGFAQDDLLSEIENDSSKTKKKDFTQASFKSTRIINSHSLECLGKRSMDFRISHRFADLNGGVNTFFGIDGPATIKLAFEYSFDGRFMFGLGRTNYQKLYDITLKYRLLRQTTDNRMPISVTALFIANMVSVKEDTINNYTNFGRRLANVSQLIIGRKFSKRLTLQVAPTYIHINYNPMTGKSEDHFAVGGGGRFKFTRSMALTVDYTYRIDAGTSNFNNFHNNLGIGLDVETGGHVFQVFVVNSTSLNEAQFIPFTGNTWEKGAIRLGFNVSRTFRL